MAMILGRRRGQAFLVGDCEIRVTGVWPSNVELEITQAGRVAPRKILEWNGKDVQIGPDFWVSIKNINRQRVNLLIDVDATVRIWRKERGPLPAQTE